MYKHSTPKGIFLGYLITGISVVSKVKLILNLMAITIKTKMSSDSHDYKKWSKYQIS